MVGFTYNLERDPNPNELPDKYAEFDSAETVERIRSALQTNGNIVVPMEADETALEKLIQTKFNIIFNIAEGHQNSGNRESLFPAIFDFLKIPFVGSDSLALALSLNKPYTKRILLEHGISTPRFKTVEKLEDLSDLNLTFPLIIKPSHEGSSRGIFNDSYVENADSLESKVARILKDYEQPVIIEEFIAGREFSVLIIGNHDPYEILPPVEITFEGLPEDIKPFCSYEVKTTYFHSGSVTCPANITKEQESQLKLTALRAYKAVKLRDFGRIDMRMNKDGDIFIIEVSPLPSFYYSTDVRNSIMRAGSAAGYGYTDLIQRILREGLKRVKNGSKKNHKRSATRKFIRKNHQEKVKAISY